MTDIKFPVSQTIRYADGTETTVFYTPLGEKMSEVESVQVPEQPVEVQAGVSEQPIEAPATPEAESAE